MYADKVFYNGNFYCVKPRGKFVSSVAIKDGKFIAVGDLTEIEKYVASSTEVIDLEGKTVLPGLHEPHIHAMNGGYNKLFRCRLPEKESISIEEILVSIKEYANKFKNREWIVGGNWPFELKPKLHKSLLDEIDCSRPMVFLDFSTHNAWVNSKALKIAGITASTESPFGGEIVKDSDGEPTGLLLENAVNLINEHIPKFERTEVLKSIEWVGGYLHSFGFTAIKEPSVDEMILECYKNLADENKLNLRVSTCLLWKSSYANNTPYEEQIVLVENRMKYNHELLNNNFVKIFLDGVPAYKTAAFLQPYAGDSEECFDWKDNMLIAPEELKEDLVELDRKKITVKMHATGDASVRAALDAIEAARKFNGNSGLLHEVAHNGFIDEEDIPRFKELNAVAEFSPPFWFPSEFQTLKEEILGKERAGRTFPVNSVLKTDALVVSGSDWPVSNSPNPWPIIESLVTRQNPSSNSSEVLNENEVIELYDAIEFYTINAAKTMYLESLTGSIEVGKQADMIILDKNIFDIPKREISQITVEQTIIGGKVIYELS